MNKNEWYWMDKVSGGNHHYNEGNEIINQGKTPQQMEASYKGAFVAFLALGILTDREYDMGTDKKLVKVKSNHAGDMGRYERFCSEESKKEVHS